MARLLVSVRTAAEAQAALTGGAGLIDVKEPANGSLGRADRETWSAVRAVVPAAIPLSFALGELAELESSLESLANPWPEVAYLKLGLSAADQRWRERWRGVREAIGRLAPASGWVAVVYTDWRAAGSPEPGAIVAEALRISSCRGVLFDSWDKSRPARYDPAWRSLSATIKAAGRFVAGAGGLEKGSLDRAAVLKPDVIAVRGAACRGDSRLGEVDAGLVAALAREAASIPV